MKHAPVVNNMLVLTGSLPKEDRFTFFFVTKISIFFKVI